MFWELEWTDRDGAVVDRECVPLTTGPDLSALLDLPVAELMFHVERTVDRWTVEVEHVAGPALVGLRVADDRPAELTGRMFATGDPRPLLPGNRRMFTVEWHGDDGPRRVLLESWNSKQFIVPGQPSMTMEERA